MKGWRIVGAASFLLMVAFGAVVSIYGTDEQGLRMLVRTTARLSFLLFLAVYLASSARRLWPNDVTKWLLVNRRYLGVSFFVAHGLHLDAILMLDTLLGDALVTDALTLLGGGLVYLLITAMALTSSDRAVRWLGAKRWGTLHRVGIHYVWAIWLLQWLPMGFMSPIYGLFLLLTLAALGVRIAARRSRATSSQPASAEMTS